MDELSGSGLSVRCFLIEGQVSLSLCVCPQPLTVPDPPLYVTVVQPFPPYDRLRTAELRREKFGFAYFSYQNSEFSNCTSLYLF